MKSGVSNRPRMQKVFNLFPISHQIINTRSSGKPVISISRPQQRRRRCQSSDHFCWLNKHIDMWWLTLVVNSAGSGTYKRPGTPERTFLDQLLWSRKIHSRCPDQRTWGKETLLFACLLSFSLASSSSYYGISLFLLDSASLGFPCRLYRNCPSGLQC